MTSILHDEQSDTRSLRWVIVQGATLTIALVALVFLVGSGLYISYENVHTFVSNHGKYGQHAQLAALGVDVLTLTGPRIDMVSSPSVRGRRGGCGPRAV